jgi:hypothetical protein
MPNNDSESTKDILLDIYKQLNRLRDRVEDNDETIIQRLDDIAATMATRFDRIEARFDRIEARFDIIEGKIDSIRVGATDKSMDPLDGTIPTDLKDEYEDTLKNFLKNQWNRNRDDSIRTAEEVNFAYDCVMKFVQHELNLLNDSMFVRNAKGSTWRYVADKYKQIMINNVEAKAVKHQIFLRHCAGHWLTKRIFSRKLLDMGKNKSAK